MTARRSAGLLLYRMRHPDVPAGGDEAAVSGAAGGGEDPGGGAQALGGDDTRQAGGIEVLVGHMGGPLWARREAGAWTIPKGEYWPPEEPLAAARREFREELGVPPPHGAVIDLGSVRQSGGKTVTVFAVRGDLDPAAIDPGTFTMEWPPRSGMRQEFPELDRVAWMSPRRASELLVTAQRAFLNRLVAALAEAGDQSRR